MNQYGYVMSVEQNEVMLDFKSVDTRDLYQMVEQEVDTQDLIDFKDMETQTVIKNKTTEMGIMAVASQEF